MTNQKHVHKFKRHKYKNGTLVYFCTMNCDYKIEVATALGKECLCNVCGNPFTMDEYTVKLAKPHCRNCGKIRITDADGKNSYIDRNRVNVVAAELADKPVESLRDRMSKVVTLERDEDI